MTAGDAEISKRLDVRVGDRAQQPRRQRALKRKRRSLLRLVIDRHSKTAGVLTEPAQ